MKLEPPDNCSLCQRLRSFRRDNRKRQPDWFNAPVPSFGNRNARLLIVGLAPGMSGANRTGRPFTGDYAGKVLYDAIEKHGFSHGTYKEHAADGLQLVDTVITNAVRCVPPQNKPVGDEITNCRTFLHATITSLPRLRVILALGKIAHDSTIRALQLKQREFPFGHGARYLAVGNGHPIEIVSSYHCSRYNINTRRLTVGMFDSVFQTISKILRESRDTLVASQGSLESSPRAQFS